MPAGVGRRTLAAATSAHSTPPAGGVRGAGRPAGICSRWRHRSTVRSLTPNRSAICGSDAPAAASARTAMVRSARFNGGLTPGWSTVRRTATRSMTRAPGPGLASPCGCRGRVVDGGLIPGQRRRVAEGLGPPPGLRRGTRRHAQPVVHITHLPPSLHRDQVAITGQQAGCVPRAGGRELVVTPPHGQQSLDPSHRADPRDVAGCPCGVHPLQGEHQPPALPSPAARVHGSRPGSLSPRCRSTPWPAPAHAPAHEPSAAAPTGPESARRRCTSSGPRPGRADRPPPTPSDTPPEPPESR